MRHLNWAPRPVKSKMINMWGMNNEHVRNHGFTKELKMINMKILETSGSPRRRDGDHGFADLLKSHEFVTSQPGVSFCHQNLNCHGNVDCNHPPGFGCTFGLYWLACSFGQCTLLVCWLQRGWGCTGWPTCWSRTRRTRCLRTRWSRTGRRRRWGQVGFQGLLCKGWIDQWVAGSLLHSWVQKHWQRIRLIMGRVPNLTCNKTSKAGPACLTEKVSWGWASGRERRRSTCF